MTEQSSSLAGSGGLTRALSLSHHLLAPFSSAAVSFFRLTQHGEKDDFPHAHDDRTTGRGEQW